MNTILRRYCKENVIIKITEFKLLDVSVYGCDACFDIEIHDKESGVLLETTYENVDNAFMGVDDSEEIYYFLEDKEIDFSEQYDDDFTKLPEDLQEEYGEYLLNLYDDNYHEYFFEEESQQEEMAEKIMKQLWVDSSRLYLIQGEKVCWIDVTVDYEGICPHSGDVEINRVYYPDMEGWIYEACGCYFYFELVSGMLSNDFSFRLCERDETSKYIVTQQDLDSNRFYGYHGKPGDLLYDYNEVDKIGF